MSVSNESDQQLKNKKHFGSHRNPISFETTIRTLEKNFKKVIYEKP